jgi:hypothetical protein
MFESDKEAEVSAEVSAEVDVKKEIGRIVLGGMQGQSELDEAVSVLVDHYGVEDNSVTPLDIAKEAQQLICDDADDLIDESEFEERLVDILGKALIAKSPLD